MEQRDSMRPDRDDIDVAEYSKGSEVNHQPNVRQAFQPDTERTVHLSPSQPGKANVRESYHRHLPHQTPTGFPIFLTWNLKGSLPRHVIAALARRRRELEGQSRRSEESKQQRNIRHAKILFAHRDRYLDTTNDGPMHLKDASAAQIVVQSIVWGVPERYELYAYAVMGNHAHVLVSPQVELKVIMQGIKGYTAHEINRLQNQLGRVFWQDELYDHWARDEDEMGRIIEYIENNPVVAALCKRPEEWTWSSAAWRERLDWKAGQAFKAEWKEIVGKG